ncbi:MAG: serine protein kinase RIO [Candidatus Woesearchaeota archaeon]
MAKITREKFKTRNNVFDAFTERNLFELASKGLFDEETMSPIKIGKEANVFSVTKDGEKRAVKIYRLEACDFNRMYEYLAVDPRFSGLKHRKRQIIFNWCKREYSNLQKARYHGINCPAPYAYKDNILVMQFIGDTEPAPQLKDYYTSKWKPLYDKTVVMLKKLYSEAGISHGDLSKFNILVHNNTPFFIDFSQSVPLESPNSRLLLERDAKNIADFFARHGIKTSQEEILERVLQKDKKK